jgi:hypothetical protein
MGLSHFVPNNSILVSIFETFTSRSLTENHSLLPFCDHHAAASRPYRRIRDVEARLTYKQVRLLVMAAESKIAEFHNQIARLERETGKEWEGDDIDEWDANYIAILRVLWKN